MTLSELRQTVRAVAQQIINDHTAYPLVVETDNRDVVDQAFQVNPYLAISIKPLRGEQAEIGVAPLSKMEGQIQISAVVKDGSGTADAEDLLDFVLPYFHLQNLATVQCQAAFPTGGREVKGWWYESAIVPYYYFSK